MIPMLRQSYDTPFNSLHRELDRALDRMAGYFENGESQTGRYPVDIREEPDHLIVEAELPGFTRNQIDVSIDQQVLTITAERKPTEPTGDMHVNERRFHKVQRRFNLPSTIDPTQVQASLHDGVLKLQLAKREEVKPRKIEVS